MAAPPRSGSAGRRAAGIGAMLTYVAVTDNCPITGTMAKLPYNRTAPCDIEGVLAELSADAA